MYDNKGAIDLSKNPVQHSRTKHIEICHYFLRDNVQKGNISIENVSSKHNIANILTKPLKRDPFNYLRLESSSYKRGETRHEHWEDLIRENKFGLRGNRDHLSACLAHMLYCIVVEQQYNLSYFIENARASPKANLPYVMRPLVLVQAQQPRKDRGSQIPCHSTSSTFIYHYGSSSHQVNDDEDGQNEFTSQASTPSPTFYLNSLSPLRHHQYIIPTTSQQKSGILFKRQTSLLNRQQQVHEEQRGAFMLFVKTLIGAFSRKKK
nr:retrotransposon protein, putative, unclassified [Tanacetum cinerariifolium]